MTGKSHPDKGARGASTLIALGCTSRLIITVYSVRRTEYSVLRTHSSSSLCFTAEATTFACSFDGMIS